MTLFETVIDLAGGAEVLRRRRYGVVEMAGGRFRRVRLRPFPAVVTAPGILLAGGSVHRFWPGDRLWLYYNQPWRFPDFLVLKYVVSARETSLTTLRRALDVLDEIARLKRSDALLCDVGNWRISRRLMTRLGWTPHCPLRWHRHYIKRFYPKDKTPDLAAWQACCRRVAEWSAGRPARGREECCVG